MNASDQKRKRVVILGGGFGGVYAAMHLEQELKGRDDFDIHLVNRENYFVYQPMLAEVVSDSVGILDTVSPIRRLAPRTDLHVREIESIDLKGKTVTLSPGLRPHPFVLEYDYLILALGTVTDFRGMAGMHEHALPFKSLADAVHLRNHLIHVLEEADNERDPELRKQLLTFVVAGGGFSGTEVVAEIYDFVHHVSKSYRDIDSKEIKVILLHAGERVLEMELSEKLSKYAQAALEKRIDVRTKTMLTAATPEEAILKSGERIPTKTLVSTVPAFPNPVIDTLDLPKERGRIKCNLAMEVEGATDLWAIGDCALIPNPTGTGYCPPTAQHALREAKIAAHNIVVAMRGGEKIEFGFKGLGKMGLLGHHKAVAELFDRFQFSGLLAWLMWRFIYWVKLPGLDRKIKVGLSWFLNMIFPPDLVQLKMGYSNKGVAHAHYEPGETVYREGDIGDYLYIILSGKVETFRNVNGSQKLVARLNAGEFFGWQAVLNEKRRSVTVKCTETMDVLMLPKGEFNTIVMNLPQLRQTFDRMLEQRQMRRDKEKVS